MKNAYEVLNERETELARIRKEIESLNIVARLLEDEDDGETGSNILGQSSEDSNGSSRSLNETISRLSDAAATSAETMFSSAAESRPKFWSALKRAT